MSSLSTIITTYLKVEVMTGETAQHVFYTLLKVLADFGISARKLMSLGTDGALVMIGSENGLTAKMRKLNPHLVPVHCCCHHLNLSASDVCKRHADVQVLIYHFELWTKGYCKTPKINYYCECNPL